MKKLLEILIKVKLIFYCHHVWSKSLLKFEKFFLKKYYIFEFK